jgi:hypothetical protein
MRAEDIKELLETKPFRPFRIFMTDGKTYDIPHPDFVWVLKSRFLVGMDGDTKNGIPDRADHCSLLHVVRVEELSSRKPK